MTQSSLQNTVHIPVLLDEVIELLAPRPGGCYIDGTLGGGGHTQAIIQHSQWGATVIGMDRDEAALDRTKQRLLAFWEARRANQNNRPENLPVRFVHANFRYFDEALDLLKIDQIDGMLLDLGLSSDQLADRERGFSFEAVGPLDLRFDVTEGETGVEMLQRLKEEDIANVIFRFGGERYSRQIARRIVKRCQEGKAIQTAADLAELVRSCVPRQQHGRSIDPATRTFQALRIAVNDELGSLEAVLKTLPERLKPEGVLVVMSFHSLEDRIVKNAFRDDPRWEILTKKPIVASKEEVERNPRARSAKLRAAKCR